MKKALVFLAAILVVVGGIALFKYRHLLFRPDINRAGGTFLTFEVEEWHAPDHDIAALARALQGRLDPNGASGITVRPEGEDSVVVGVPNGARHDDQVEQVKRLAGRSGKLELRVVANRTDDAAALGAAEAYLRDPKNRTELARREKSDTPPPPPTNVRGGTTFRIRLAGAESEHAYSWAPLASSELESLGLSPMMLSRPENAPLRASVEQAVKERQLLLVPTLPDSPLYAHRPSPTADPTFFFLTRHSEEGKEVTGEFLEQARPATSREAMTRRGTGPAGVWFRFKPEGAERLHELTSRNRAGEAKEELRRLAILLDGQVVSAPLLYSILRDSGVITGQFTPSEVEDLVLILRGGALPARLKPEPVRVTTSGPRR